MTHREAIRAVFQGAKVSQPPVSIRLNLWHTDALARGALPPEVANLSCQEIEDHLGFARAARFSAQPFLDFTTADFVVSQAGDLTREEYRFPGGTLVRKSRCTEDMKRQGMAAHTTKYPLADERDYDLLLRHIGSARLAVRTEGFSELDAQTGDRGLPMLILGSCPAHLLMLRFAGYNNVYFHLADFPGKVAELIEAIGTIFRRDLWPMAGLSEAELILHGNHFSSQMTPRPVFEQFFLPYLSEFIEVMRARGKHVLVHADAEMGGLLDLVVAAGFSGTDCLATQPLAPQRLEDYFDAWQGKVVCWGGLPSTIFDPSFPLDTYRTYVSDIVELTRDRGDFIFGASDNVMPGAEWERLVFLSEVTK